jgi:hypothetical protein
MRRGSGSEPVSRRGFFRALPVRDRATFFPADGPPVSLPFRTLFVRPAAKFVKEFDEVLEADDVEVKRVGAAGPPPTSTPTPSVVQPVVGFRWPVRLEQSLFNPIR